MFNTRPFVPIAGAIPDGSVTLAKLAAEVLLADIKPVTGTTYDIDGSDKGKFLYFTNAAGCEVTYPATSELDVGHTVTLVQGTGAGTISVVLDDDANDDITAGVAATQGIGSTLTLQLLEENKIFTYGGMAPLLVALATLSSDAGILYQSDADSLTKLTYTQLITNAKLYGSFPAYDNTRWYPSFFETRRNSSVFAKDTLWSLPFLVREAITIDKLGIICTGAGDGSTNARIGLYNCDQNTLYPTSLIYDSGNLSIASTGTKSVTGVAQALTAGWYAMAENHNSTTTPTFDASDSTGGHNGILGATAANLSCFSIASVASTFGALPSTFPAGASPGTGAAQAPRVMFQIA